MKTTVDEERLEALLKAAAVEVLEERSDFLGEIVEGALEDLALVRAIEEGRGTPIVDRHEGLSILGGEE